MNVKNIVVGGSGQIKEPAHIGDVGHDLVASQGPFFKGTPFGEDVFSDLWFIEYDTNVILAPDEGTYTLVYPRSSISENTNLLLGNSVGVIDNAYRNTVKLRFKYLPQPKDYRFIDGLIYVKIDRSRLYKVGDKIGQAVFMRDLPTLLSTGSLSKTARGEDGFGSTGK
jgi:dUTPase